MVTEMAPTYRANRIEPLIAQSKGSNGDGVQNVIDFMDAYDLTKDDMDSIIGETQFYYYFRRDRIQMKMSARQIALTNFIPLAHQVFSI